MPGPPEGFLEQFPGQEAGELELTVQLLALRSHCGHLQTKPCQISPAKCPTYSLLHILSNPNHPPN